MPTDGIITNYTLTMLERQKMHLKSQETELLSRVDQEAKVHYDFFIITSVIHPVEFIKLDLRLLTSNDMLFIYSNVPLDDLR